MTEKEKSPSFTTCEAMGLEPVCEECPLQEFCKETDAMIEAQGGFN